MRERWPDVRLETVGVTTTGDRRRTVPIPDLGQGVFVKELEVALVTREIDFAVHSLKDLPTRLPPGLCLVAVLPRGDPRDALVSREARRLADLPAGARVGTGSPRRAAQVLARRPDLSIVLLRGNVDTRIRKVLEEGQAEAAVLAAAGLARLGLEDLVTEYFPVEAMVPAVGQGFLAIECREDDREACELAARTEDAEARRAADAERAFLAAIGGFCRTPMACFATVEHGVLSMEGLIATDDGKRVIRERMSWRADFPPTDAGLAMKEALFARGAEEIMAQGEEARPR